MELPKRLEPFQGKIEGIRHSHHDCYRANCPRCGSDELRIFESGLEVRCPSCRANTFGLDQFLARFVEEEEPRVGAEGIDLPEEEAPEPKKATRGSCEVCGGEFEILPYTRRAKRYCSKTCQKRAERQRKRKGLS